MARVPPDPAIRGGKGLEDEHGKQNMTVSRAGSDALFRKAPNHYRDLDAAQKESAGESLHAHVLVGE